MKIPVNKETRSPIKGTLEKITGCCGFSSCERAADGSINYEHDGETEVYWDDQETATDVMNRIIYLDDDGAEVTANQIDWECDGDKRNPCEDEDCQKCCEHNYMVPNTEAISVLFPWKCADCGYVYGPGDKLGHFIKEATK